MSRKTLITGWGALTAAGVGPEPLWKLLVEGGGAPLTEHTPEPAPGLPPGEPVTLAALPPYSPEDHLEKRGLRTLSSESTAFSVAVAEACRHAGLPGRWDAEPSVGVAAGTTSAGLSDYTGLFTGRLERGAARVNPAQGPQTGLNAPASVASIRAGAAGPNLTLSTGRAASVDALAESARAVRSGAAVTMLAGGVQTLSDTEVRARRCADPGFGTAGAARPFDRARSAAVPGEAAVVFVLEDAESAAARGAAALAEVAGAGSAFGGGDAARRAIQAALAEAGVAPEAVDAVVASANGTEGLDAAEAAAIFAVCGGEVPVCAVQGALGDCAGATGAVQTAVAVLALGSGLLPGSAGFRDPDPGLPALALSSEPRPHGGSRVLVSALDPDGCAAALLLHAPPMFSGGDSA